MMRSCRFISSSCACKRTKQLHLYSKPLCHQCMRLKHAAGTDRVAHGAWPPALTLNYFSNQDTDHPAMVVAARRASIIAIKLDAGVPPVSHHWKQHLWFLTLLLITSILCMIQSVGLARLIIPAYSISSKILPLVWRQPMEILPCPGMSAHLAVRVCFLLQLAQALRIFI